MGLWRELGPTVRADLESMARLKGRPKLGVVGAVDVLALPGTWSVLLFRLSAACHHSLVLRPFSRLLYFLNVVLFSADLAPGATIGPGLAIAHPVGTGWGNGLTVGRNAIMTGMVRFGTAAAGDSTRFGEPTLGDDVVVLDGAKAMGPVRIGDRAVLAANCLVLHDVAADAIVVGQPARVVHSRHDRPGNRDRLVDALTATAGVAESTDATATGSAGRATGQAADVTPYPTGEASPDGTDSTGLANSA